mgnify:CR=1 FL=1
MQGRPTPQPSNQKGGGCTSRVQSPDDGVCVGVFKGDV